MRSSDFPSPAAGAITLAALYSYPIKSCRGRAVQEARVTRRGLEDDRRMMVVDRDGVFLSQRTLPRMALVEPELSGPTLLLRAPGAGEVRVEVSQEGPRREVSVWGDRCLAVEQHPAASQWFSDLLGQHCTLVRQLDSERRPVDPDFALSPADEVSFADGYPLLLCSEESLADLNARVDGEPLPMDRFRPSAVVRGGGAYAEDGWDRFRIGAVGFAGVKPCARCVITTIDQRTAEKGHEPLRALAGYRRGRRGVLFGQNLIPTSTGVLRVGDVVTLSP